MIPVSHLLCLSWIVVSFLPYGRFTGKVHCPCNVRLPSPSEYRELKDLLNLPNDHDDEMLNTVKVLVNDSGSKEIPIGFKPSCKCNAGFEPGTVLDPFAGSGTVGVVAKEQGKNAILIEVSPEYLEIIKNRLEIKRSGTEINAGFVDVASIESMEEDE